MDCVSPILDATCRFCSCIRDTTYYIRHLHDNLDSLRTEMGTLKRQRDDLKRQVEAAERLPMQQRTEQVDGWLQRVEQLEREVEELLQQGDEQIQQKCLKICPRNCWSTHKLGKRVSDKLQAVSNMKSEGNFSTVAVPMAAEHAEETPLGRTVGLDANFHKLLSLLRDDGTGIIGIYGMGGVGKTTLLKKINNELASQSRSEFDEVIWVTVSKDLSSVESIQDKIGKKLQFPDDIWRGKSQEEKKADIFKVLKRKRFVLLLDDIWKRIDLLEVGVPVPDIQNKAKIIFTTRSEGVCGLMEAKKKIKAECLAWEEAWDLFKDKVGEEMINSDSEIARLAKEVCKECAGLPLALSTVGRAMASKKTPQEWDYAVCELKKSIFKFSDMGDQVFPLLKFSYDYLSDETIKICFLYCALFPEDHDIRVSDLIRLWIGEGFLDVECDNIDDACKLAYDIIGRLKLACLLVESSDSYTVCVHMHDLIRDMALWIVREKGIVWESGSEKLKYLVRGESPKWEKTERVLLLGISIEKLSESPRCPNLLTLILRDYFLRTISNSFFQFMPTLKVLDLSYNFGLSKLPTSFFGLVSLQYLDLSATSIGELPIEFKSLVKLKYLYLNATDELEMIPPQVISSLLILQRLEILSGVSSEGIDEGSILFGGNELLLDELECLNHLQYLSLTVKTELALQKLLSSQKFSSFTFGLGISGFKGSSSMQMSSLQKNMKRLETLGIVNCDDIEELTMDGMRWEESERPLKNNHHHHHPWDIKKSIIDGSKSFHNLRDVLIGNCKVLKDVTWLICVPNLRSLLIGACDAMKEVIKDADQEDCSNVFAKLQTLTLSGLGELKSIYSHPLPFPSLTYIQVSGCPKLSKLPLDSKSNGKGSLREIQCKGEWRDKLEWENKETRSAFFPLFNCRS